MKNRFGMLCALLLLPLELPAQDYMHYSGKTKVNIDYHHGLLTPAVGVHNIQTLRANRKYPKKSDGFGWTYNHAPMLAYCNKNGTFYLQYLSNETGEHVPPGQVLMQTSKDGRRWTKPVVLFPPYDVPDGYSKNGKGTPAKNLQTVVHQRVGFFTSSTGKLLTMGFYGVCLGNGDGPNDGEGIGRVVREIKDNGDLGPIFFIRYNHNFNETNATRYPFYRKSRDQAFVAACNELLAHPLYMMQWVEEADRDDPLIPLKKDYKAFCYYRLDDGRIVGLWKNGLTSISADGGLTWAEVRRAPGVVTGNAKMWGQRLSDGSFATVYDPSEFRWPLAVSLSNDGLNYSDLWLVHGDITPLRYHGAEKSRGPQYVRGILENNGAPPDGNLWVTYSVNKEDIWVSKIPVPVSNRALCHADDTFDHLPEGKELDSWNIYSPLWASAGVEKPAGKRLLTLKDRDLFDYAKAERIIPETEDLHASFAVQPMQDNRDLQIEFQDAKGLACSRILFDKDGVLRLKNNYKYSSLLNYKAGKRYEFDIRLSVATRSLTLTVDGKTTTRLFFAPVDAISRIVFRTGNVPEIPTANTPYTSDADLPLADEEEPETATFYIDYLKTESTVPAAALLRANDFRSYVDRFNAMEDENIAQAIPNAEAWDWMKANIPLFECPQANFEEIYYYRWWSLRKHIRDTPIGHVITEFLVPRPYADQYNMIACALGHHIYEARWLHNREYVNQYVRAWYRGNEGQPMRQLRKFSSWTADALYNKYKVDADSACLLDMTPDLEADYAAWGDDHLLPSGLYWQEDVRDGMEESISGGRKKQYARPTINSYMYGNAKALAEMNRLKGDLPAAKRYEQQAARLKELIQTQLWHPDSLFFETLRAPGQWAEVREAIGFIPWYFNLPDAGKGYEQAWLQAGDPQGFLAPYGLTTAERRHPEFRTHGCCSCEWDGAVWPFASAQTLTALANYLNSDPRPVVDRRLYFQLMERYVESQHHRGKPYVGEYLDEKTGYWLKGDQERSRYYNHSTFNDLLITGLVGLRPRPDHVLEINPLLPPDTWNWFCLDKISYHGKIITVVWDKTGERYRQGKGFYVLVNGQKVAHAHQLQKLTTRLEK